MKIDIPKEDLGWYLSFDIPYSGKCLDLLVKEKVLEEDEYNYYCEWVTDINGSIPIVIDRTGSRDDMSFSPKDVVLRVLPDKHQILLCPDSVKGLEDVRGCIVISRDRNLIEKISQFKVIFVDDVKNPKTSYGVIKKNHNNFLHQLTGVGSDSVALKLDTSVNTSLCKLVRLFSEQGKFLLRAVRLYREDQMYKNS